MACTWCRGVFFRTPDLQAFVEHPTNAEPGGNGAPLAPSQMRAYPRCPACTEPMSPFIVPGSQVIIDQCRNHGFWLDSGKLTRLRIWWRSEAGKNLHLIDSLNERRRPEPKAAEPVTQGRSWFGVVLEIVFEILLSGI